MDFLKELLAGEVFDCKKMVQDSHKKVVRLDSYVKTRSPIWPKVKDKFIENITKIDNQNIGPGEILFIYKELIIKKLLNYDEANNNESN